MKLDAMDSPYVGLVPFSEKEAERFCGRETETEALVSLTLGRRCLVVHGPSGVGKSSLLRAGVTADLHKIAAAQKGAFGNPDFVVAYCSDWKDAEPFHVVRMAIEKAWGTNLSGARHLRDCVAKGVKETATDLVLILDQFEEFFLYHPDAIPLPETAAGGWLSQISQLMAPGPSNGPNERSVILPIHLVITLREEALAKLDGLQKLYPALFENVYRVAPLTTTQARRAVVDPVTWWNEHHPSESPVTVTDEFAAKVTDEVRQGNVGFEQLSKARQSSNESPSRVDAVEAPFLQLVLETVWIESRKRWEQSPDLKRTLDSKILDELGGAPVIVNNHLKAILEDSIDSTGKPNFSPEELELVARLSLHLVTVDLAKIAHSSASLAGFVERPENEVKSILERLERSRILRRTTVPSSPNQDRFEISHDMLGKAIVNWRPTYLKKVEITKVEKEISQRNIKLSLIAAGITLVILGSLLVVALLALSDARKQRAIAEIERGKAEALRRVSEDERTKADKQREIAEAESAEARRLQLELSKELDAARESAKRDIQNQSKEEAEKRLARERELNEVTTLIGKFLEKHPSYREELGAASTQISQSVNQLRDPRIATLISEGPIRAAAYSPDGRYIAVGSENKKLYLWSRNGGDPLAQTSASSSKGGVSSLAFSPSQGFLLTGSAGSSIRLFDPRRSELGDGLEVAVQNSVNFITFSKDGHYSVSLDDDRQAVLRDWSNYPKLLPKDPTARLKHNGTVSFANFSADGSRIVTSCDDGMVRVFQTSGSGDLLEIEINGFSNNPLNVNAPTRKFRFSPTDRDLAVGGAGYSKLVWFYLSGNRKSLYQDHTKDASERGPFVHGAKGAVWDVAFSPAGTHLASIGTDGLCLIWDVKSAKTVASIPTEIGGRLFDVEWSGSGLLALAGEDGRIELWELINPLVPKPIFSTRAHRCPVWSVQFDPLGEQLLTFGRDIRPIEEAVTDASDRAAEWKLPPGFPSEDFTASIWDINAARSRGWNQSVVPILKALAESGYTDPRDGGAPRADSDIKTWFARIEEDDKNLGVPEPRRTAQFVIKINSALGGSIEAWNLIEGNFSTPQDLAEQAR